MNKIWRWLVISSADPNRVSAFVKGLLGLVPSAVILFNLLQINISADALVSLIEYMAILTSAGASVITAGVAIFGLVRKIVRTSRGEHLGTLEY